jgi:hypothetical protein
MKRSAPFVLVSVLTAFVAGCSTLPPGFTRAEWNALTPQQQARYTAAARNADLPSFKSQISSARSEADSTISNLNRGNFDSSYRDTSPGAVK